MTLYARERQNWTGDINFNSFHIQARSDSYSNSHDP